MSKVIARELIKDRLRNSPYHGLYDALWYGREEYFDGPDIEFLCEIIEEILDIRKVEND